MTDTKPFACNVIVCCRENVMCDAFGKSLEEIFPNNRPYIILDNTSYSSEKFRQFIHEIQDSIKKACPEECDVTVRTIFISNPTTIGTRISKFGDNENDIAYVMPVQEVNFIKINWGDNK